jgi:hypothetical protein
MNQWITVLLGLLPDLADRPNHATGNTSDANKTAAGYFVFIFPQPVPRDAIP